MITDISKHFLRYQEGINTDFMDGVGKYSKELPTKDLQRYPTAYNYINSVLTSIKSSIHHRNVNSYRTYMELHQKAILALFAHYVETFLAEHIEMWGVDKRLLMDFMIEKGVKWYKFSKHVFKFNDGIMVVPRHHEFPNEDAHVIVDADEIRLFMLRGLPLEKAIQAKEKYSCNLDEKIVSFQDNEVGKIPISELNTKGEIHDWSAPLFKD